MFFCVSLTFYFIRNRNDIYLFLIASIGFLEAIFFTGRKLASVATKRLTINKRRIWRGPKFNTVIKTPSSFLIATLIIVVATNTPIAESRKLIMAIIKLSEKKIRNTSLLLEPIARRIPISCFLCEILVPIKFASIKDANTANPIPI